MKKTKRSTRGHEDGGCVRTYIKQLCKIRSIVVHVEEGAGEDGHTFPIEAAIPLDCLSRSRGRNWIEGMRNKATRHGKASLITRYREIDHGQLSGPIHCLLQDLGSSSKDEPMRELFAAGLMRPYREMVLQLVVALAATCGNRGQPAARLSWLPLAWR